MRFLWAALGLICVALAIIGVALPLLPTVPFLLLAAFFFCPLVHPLAQLAVVTQNIWTIH